MKQKIGKRAWGADLTIDEDISKRWSLKRSKHWRRNTVAEWSIPNEGKGVQFTLKELVEEVIASNEAQEQYHEEAKSLKKRALIQSATSLPPIEELDIDYLAIAKGLYRLFWLQHVGNVANAEFMSGKVLDVRQPTPSDVDHATGELKRQLPTIIGDAVARFIKRQSIAVER